MALCAWMGGGGEELRIDVAGDVTKAHIARGVASRTLSAAD